MSEKSIHFVVSGTVQGVSFRASTRDQAQKRNIVGWVKNLDDGRVEGLASGEASAIDELLQWLEHGPGLAEVESLEYQEVDNPDLLRFEVRY